ncbi:MAG TPA: ATP-binding protein, partial [Trichormus sp.]
LFVGILGYFFYMSNTQLARIGVASNHIDKATTILLHTLDMVDYQTKYYVSKSPKDMRYYEEFAAAIPGELVELKQNLASDPPAAQAFSPVEETVNSMLGWCQKLHTQMLSGDTVVNFADLMQLKKILVQTRREFADFMQYERDIADRRPVVQAQYQNIIWFILADGLLLNICIAIWLARYLYRVSAQRLNALLGHIQNFAANRPIGEPIAGSDEIAQLDVHFGAMARSLAQAAENERNFNQKIHSIIENMPVGLVITDTAGVIELVNSAALDTFHCGQDKLLKQEIKTLFAADDNDSVPFIDLLRDKAVGRTLLKNALRIDGEPFDAELSVTNLETLEGPRLLVIILDVTQRRQLEKLKQEFVAMVSHDLKTPLTSIKGSLMLLSTGAYGQVSDRAEEIINVAETEVDRLTRLVKDLLDLTKIEAGRMQLYYADLSVDAIIKRSIASVGQFAERHQVTLETEIARVEIEADCDRLVQVLVNLLTNAIKFSEAGSTVSIQVDKSDEESIAIAVVDTGRGVPPAKLHMIFQPYRQVEGSDEREKEGTGLGLSICKNIVEQHGGTLGVSSEEGKGSTFWFKIPRRPAGQTVALESPDAIDAP